MSVSNRTKNCQILQTHASGRLHLLSVGLRVWKEKTYLWVKSKVRPINLKEHFTKARITCLQRSDKELSSICAPCFHVVIMSISICIEMYVSDLLPSPLTLTSTFLPPPRWKVVISICKWLSRQINIPDSLVLCSGQLVQRR